MLCNTAMQICIYQFTLIKFYCMYCMFNVLVIFIYLCTINKDLFCNFSPVWCWCWWWWWLLLLLKGGELWEVLLIVSWANVGFSGWATVGWLLVGCGWANHMPMSKKKWGQRWQSLLGQHNSTCWPNVGPTTECYLGGERRAPRHHLLGHLTQCYALFVLV